MIKGQKSSNRGIENFLCPFTDMYISQDAKGTYSHKGILANDVAEVRSSYYALCTCKCIKN